MSHPCYFLHSPLFRSQNVYLSPHSPLPPTFFTHWRLAYDTSVLPQLHLLGSQVTLKAQHSVGKYKVASYSTATSVPLTNTFLILPWLLQGQLTFLVFHQLSEHGFPVSEFVFVVKIGVPLALVPATLLLFPSAVLLWDLFLALISVSKRWPPPSPMPSCYSTLPPGCSIYTCNELWQNSACQLPFQN